MSAAELARRLDVPTNRITEILNGRQAITGDTALRLAHFFGTTAQFWQICKVSMKSVSPSGSPASPSGVADAQSPRSGSRVGRIRNDSGLLL
jgi:transcriptional regulator with XRE-family HTH domain